MRIRILAVSDKMPEWVETVSKEYLKRFDSTFVVELISISAVKRTKTMSIQKAKQLECEAILKKLSDTTFCVLLDEKGKQYTSEGLSHQIEKWQLQSSDITFVIGGADGFDQNLYQRANAKWALSPLTFPHPLVRVILAEQLYRAWSISKGHPYHRS